ncbi:MAG: potassium/proton antiporter [Candidatus Binatia bacterium]
MQGFRFEGHSLEFLLLSTSFLLVFSVLTNRISSALGVPSLLLFLGIGMLAGVEGPGGIDFTNYSLSFAVGSVCLTFIIFDGGMRTSWNNVRPILPVGLSLSVLATLITAVATAVFANVVLGRSWVEALLLGAIVSSTDAAAVFSILRARSLSLKGRLKDTLEFEAGSNDPMAIFLTVGVLAYATGQATDVFSFVSLFGMQWGLGLALGWIGGHAFRWLINHAGIEYEGLYSVLLLGLVIFLFAGTSALGGSGFLAVYIAGLFLGNSELLHKGSVKRFHDGVAWLAQILVFLTLGLLSTPSHLLPVWKEGILLSSFMMFVARPLSVFLATPGSSTLERKDRLFVSWVGLRGVAPIILATLPWSVGFPNSEYLFNLVFFVVLLSVIVQGITIPWVAVKLGRIVPLREEPAHDHLAGMLLPEGFVTIEMEVGNSAAAKGTRVVDLALPSGVLLTSLERGGRYLIPKGDTAFTPGDRVWALARPSNIDVLRKLFGKAEPVSA